MERIQKKTLAVAEKIYSPEKPKPPVTAPKKPITPEKALIGAPEDLISPKKKKDQVKEKVFEHTGKWVSATCFDCVRID